jgi:SAM-dependent MidA family methyltransferase
MPDSDPEPPIRAATLFKKYPIVTPPATHSLAQVLVARIRDGGPLSFPEFMETALYHPQLGYYARCTENIGKAGDFFTSVSVGPVFGSLLARRFLRHFRESGKPRRWRIIECGAHDGTLARDVLAAIAVLDPAAFAALEYVISEPLAALREAQRATLAGLNSLVRFVASADELTAAPLPGCAFGNEVLDALPFHVVEFNAGSWHECRVMAGEDDRFTWCAAPVADRALQGGLKLLGADFPDGYRTEVRICHSAFLEPLVRALDGALMIWLDYGFARADLYQPQRRRGTLRTFKSHRAGEDPFEAPGECDITAHVDFTAVASSARSLGGTAIDFDNQGAWLTGIAREWLLAMDGHPDPAKLRQFQTLTHPAHLGGAFQVLELSWKPGAAPKDPAALQRRLFPD